MVIAMAGFVQDVVHRIRTHIPNASEESIFQIACGICHDYGGTEPYVGARIPAELRKSMVENGLQRQRPLREVFAQAGVSRRTGYRILGSK